MLISGALQRGLAGYFVRRVPERQASNSSKGSSQARLLFARCAQQILLQTGVFVENAQSHSVTSEGDILEAIAAGNARRQVASTGMNTRSSRSHSILVLDISSSSTNEADTTSGTLHARLNLVDLAGSESVRLSGAEGARLKEGSAINKSLLTLSRIINLRSKAPSSSTFMPFRESKLTHLLEPSLSGKARTAVVACMSPCAAFLEESKSTLQFATSAKSIQMAPTRNEVVDDTTRIARLRKEIVQLKAELAQSAAASAAASDSGSEAPSVASSQQQRQHRLAQLMQEFICGGSSPETGTVGGAATRGRTALGMARMARKGRSKRDRETWCPSVGASAGALAAIEAFRAAPPSPESSMLPALGSPSTSCSNRSSLGGQSTMSTSTHGSSSTACTEAEEGSLQVELHKARAGLAAARMQLASVQEDSEQKLSAAMQRISSLETDMAADAEDREEALEAALCRAEAAEAALAAKQVQDGAATQAREVASVRVAELEAMLQARLQVESELQAQLAAAEQCAERAQDQARACMMQLTEASSQHTSTQTQWKLDMAAMRSQAAVASAELSEERKRCARLEKVKVTQELIDTLKGLKSDRRALRTRVNELTSQLAQAQAQTGGHSPGNDAADAAAATYETQIASLQQMVSEKEEQLAAAESELADEQQRAGEAASALSAAQRSLQMVRDSAEVQQKQHEALVSDIAGLVETVRSTLPGILEDSNVQLPVTLSGVGSTVRVLGRVLAAKLQQAAEASAKLQDATERTVRLAQAVKTSDAAAASSAAREAEAVAQLGTVRKLQEQLGSANQQLQQAQQAAQAAQVEASAAQKAVAEAEKARAAALGAAEQAAADARSAAHTAKAAQEALATTQAEARRNSEFLEKENLQLMMELRTVRREAADGGYKGQSSQGSTPSRPPLAPSDGNTMPTTPNKGHTPSLPAATAVGADEEQGECQQQ